MKRDQLIEIMKQHVFPEPTANIVCGISGFEEAADAIVAAHQQSSAATGDEYQRCMDMLGDVPGDTLEDRLTHYIGSYMALQIKSAAEPQEVPTRQELIAAVQIAEPILDQALTFANADSKIKAIRKAIAVARSCSLTRPDRAPPPADETEAMLEIIGHLGAALIQTVPSDDQIIMGHVKSAHDLACQLRRRLAK